MGQPMAAKKGQKGFGKRGKPFVKRQQGGLAREDIADQRDNNIDEVVLAEPRERSGPAPEETSRRGKDPSKGGTFSHPGGHGWLRFRGHLDSHGRKWQTLNVFSWSEKWFLEIFSRKRDTRLLVPPLFPFIAQIKTRCATRGIFLHRR